MQGLLRSLLSSLPEIWPSEEAVQHNALTDSGSPFAFANGEPSSKAVCVCMAASLFTAVQLDAETMLSNVTGKKLP